MFTSYRKFRKTGKEVTFGIIGLLGSPEAARHWVKILPRRNFWASTLLCPAIVADSLTYAIGFCDTDIAVVQIAPSRIPPARHLRFFAYEELTVTDSVDGEYTEIRLGDSRFQVGHADAALAREVLEQRKRG